ncbi:DUF1120 domain-containing protein, partial [Pseudomonas fluorescens]|uniref:DUF1120 domain-containing protein n=1 Tax=Pseudomonas fluorescens TaxID=294 RepID=UPI00124117E5
MNKRLSLLTVALLLSSASSAYAASSTELTVTGFITPMACEPSLSGGGVVDYAKTSSKDLKPNLPTHLGQKTLQLSVDCNAATTFALDLADNNPNSAYLTHMYGLGRTPNDERIGGFE